MQSKVAFRKASFLPIPRFKFSIFASPVVPLSKIFHAFSPMNPHLSTHYKFIFDFSFDVSPHLTYRHLMNLKDGFTGSLKIGDKLFPESIELGLGDVVTAENIDELTAIFTNESLITAVADSVATALPIDVPISFVNVDAAIALLRSRFVDVDWDTFPTYVTIFGDDQRIEGDEDEGLWVLNLVIAPVAFVDTNAI